MKSESQIVIVTPRIHIRMYRSIRNVEENDFALALCVAIDDGMKRA